MNIYTITYWVRGIADPKTERKPGMAISPPTAAVSMPYWVFASETRQLQMRHLRFCRREDALWWWGHGGAEVLFYLELGGKGEEVDIRRGRGLGSGVSCKSGNDKRHV